VTLQNNIVLGEIKFSCNSPSKKMCFS